MGSDGGLVQVLRRRGHGAVGGIFAQGRCKWRVDNGHKRSAGAGNDTDKEKGEKVFGRFHAMWVSTCKVNGFREALQYPF